LEAFAPATSPTKSPDRAFDQFAVHVGEPVIAPARAEGQSPVIHPHLMQHRGVQVMHPTNLVHRTVAELIRGTDDGATTNPTAGHPHRESERIVITTVGSLGKGSPPEFSGPHEQRRIQQAAPLEIQDQRRNGLIDRTGIGLMTGLQVAVLIPAVTNGPRASDLDEANPSLHQTPRQTAFAGINPSRLERAIETVECFGLRTLSV